MPKLSKKINEPSILVRPVSRLGGLDNIHLALMVLVVILVLLLIEMSFSTKITVVNSTCQNCSTGTAQHSASHTSAQALLQAEHILASYSNYNNSLSLLPYISNVSGAKVSYLQDSGEWYVSIPYTGPINGKSYTFGVLISDSNFSKFSPLAQTISPASISQNYVVSQGVVKLHGETTCTAQNGAVPVYWFIDPYAPGAVSSLLNATRLQSTFGANVNLSVKLLTSQYSLQVADTYGLNNTLLLGKYLICGSTQSNFTAFVNAVNATYQDRYMPAYLLRELAAQSGINSTSFNSCLASSQGIINGQYVQAKYYNITSSSAVLTSCQYLSVPQTAKNAVCYSNPSLCKA